ncbi:MAG: hypothetical protein LBJ00_01860 [Planctomycetaceae bacterium]|nr:hypothetical protein [Planctomycetaceae bacterium]
MARIGLALAICFIEMVGVVDTFLFGLFFQLGRNRKFQQDQRYVEVHIFGIASVLSVQCLSGLAIRFY